MRYFSIAALALAIAAAPTLAQSKPAAKDTAKFCDPKSAFLNSPTSFGVQRATIVKACWSFEQGATNSLVAMLDSAKKLNGVQTLGLMLHGDARYDFLHPPSSPPSDTVVAPPVIVPPPPPKDTAVAPPAPPSVNAWTKLGAAGNLYTFTGLHVARWTLGDSAKALYRLAYGKLECGLSGFNNKAPSGGSGVGTCELGPTLYDTLTVPVRMGPIQTATMIVPRADPGVSVAQVRAGGGAGIKTDGSGSERITCQLAKFAFIDPIVYPGQASVSHLHMFFGNTAMNENTTPASIVSAGNSTCMGGTLNRTAYWTPAMIDAKGNAVMPDVTAVYYKTGYNMKPANTQPMPTGLRMIAGDKNATGQQVVPGPQYIVTWICLNGSAKSAGDATIPNCKAGDAVRLTVIFPQCWNGKDLDSPDHKSHMAYPNYNAGACPSTHPVQVPEVTEHYDFPVKVGDAPLTWHLSSDMDVSKPGGVSAHADWMMGWDAPTMLEFVTNCLQKALDCEIGGLGKRVLY